MANIYCLTTAIPTETNDYSRFITLACSDKYKKHRLCDSPKHSDIIIFLGSSSPDCSDITGCDVYKKYKRKSYLFDSRDRPIAYLPGVYASIEKTWYCKNRVRSGMYLKIIENEHLNGISDQIQPELLFSFVGRACTHQVRSSILKLRHTNAFVADRDDLDPESYAHHILNSKFVICPRGYGVSSFRLFETLKAGRVPVVVADEWVPPDGPKWEEFSITVKEKDVYRIPELCEKYEKSAEIMGLKASEAWSDWFGSESAFNSVANWCLDIHKTSKQNGTKYKLLICLERIKRKFSRK